MDQILVFIVRVNILCDYVLVITFASVFFLHPFIFANKFADYNLQLGFFVILEKSVWLKISNTAIIKF